MALTSAAAFPSRTEAEIARARLEAAGIPASVAGDDAGGLYPNLSPSGVQLLVDETDLVEAQEILAERP